MSAMWRSSLPVCDTSKCNCRECRSAYSCPEGAIIWQDDMIRFDYNFCKACGTCAAECVFATISMQEADKALEIEAGKGGS